MKAPLRHPVGEEEGDSVVREGNEKESVAGVTLLDVNSVYTSSLWSSVSLTRSRSKYVRVCETWHPSLHALESCVL